MEAKLKTRILGAVLGVVIILFLGATILLLLARRGYKEQMEEFQTEESTFTEEIGGMVEEAVNTEVTDEGLHPDDQVLNDETPSEYAGETTSSADQGSSVVNQYFRMNVTNVERQETIGRTEPLLGEDEFIVVHIEIENVSGTERQLIPLGELFVVDENGSEYTVAFLNEDDLENNMDGFPVFEQGEGKEGTLAYEVPKAATNLRFEYQPRNSNEEENISISIE